MLRHLPVSSFAEQLRELLTARPPDPRLIIAILDGPVDVDAPHFLGANLEQVQRARVGIASSGLAALHGNSIASTLFSQPGARIRGLTHRCRGLLIPIFSDASFTRSRTSCSQEDLARALMLAVDRGANIINVSAGELDKLGRPRATLCAALEACQRRGVLVVAAVGNNGCECMHVPAASPWCIAVGAADPAGEPRESSNWGPAYSVNGVLALGERVPCLTHERKLIRANGSSFATALITAAAASLMSDRGRLLDAAAVRHAILSTARTREVCLVSKSDQCRRLLRGRVDLIRALHTLQ